MNTFDKYIFTQQTRPFIFFSFVLVGILWLVQAMPRLDDVISNGQSGLVFIKISILLFPQVMLIILPISAFASTIYALHKLISESELLIFANAGLSNLRIVFPILIFGGFVCSILYFLSLYLVPLSQNKMRTDLYNIREEFSNRLIKDQQFFHPIKGVTIYIRESSDNGDIKGIFITDARQKDNKVTYSAKEAIMTRSSSGLMLVMQNGLLQVLDSNSTALTTLKFKRMGFELNNFLPVGPRKDISPVEIFPLKIISNPTKFGKDNIYKESEFISEAHTKLATPLSALALTLLALSFFSISGLNKRSYFKTIIFAITAAIFVQSLISALRTLVVKDTSLFWILYLPSVSCILVSLSLIIFNVTLSSFFIRKKTILK